MPVRYADATGQAVPLVILGCILVVEVAAIGIVWASTPSTGGSFQPLTNAECTAALTGCLADPVVAALIAEITKCTGSAPAVSCRDCGGTGDGDYFRGTAVVCQNRMSNPRQVCRALAHELVHMRDSSCKTYPEPSGPADCAAIICREKRAVHESGQCCPNSHYFRQLKREWEADPKNKNKTYTYTQCVQEMTLRSTKSNSPKCAEPGTFYGDYTACKTNTSLDVSKCK